MSTDITLTADEIREVTGYARPADQLRRLREMGFTRARRRRDGAVLLERLHFEAVRAGAPVQFPISDEDADPADAAFHSDARRAEAERRQTPPWADRRQIAAIYESARRLTVETGTRHEVDHEIPLRGARVSGLHVAENLRVITRTENLLKGNKFKP